MTSRALRPAVGAVRLWTRAYTAGIDPVLRDARRREIESDVWELVHDPDAGDDRARAIHLLVRLIAGVGADLHWRADTELDDLGVRRAIACTAAAAALVATLFILPAWLGDGRLAPRRSFAECALAPTQPTTRADIETRVVSCAGEFFGVRKAEASAP